MEKQYELIVFDVDGTLVSPRSGKKFRENADDWMWLPNRIEKYQALRGQGIRLAIATNQGGPMWRLATGQTKYPSTQEIGNALKQMIMQLSWSPTFCDPWFISLYDQRASALVDNVAVRELKDEMHHYLEEFNCWIGIDSSWRKPLPGMLKAAMHLYNMASDQTLYVGDRPEDEQAAIAAGVDFMWADQFFGE